MPLESALLNRIGVGIVCSFFNKSIATHIAVLFL